jgi:hypothetical protein
MTPETTIHSTGYWENTEKISHVRCESLCDWIIDYLKDFKNKQIYDFGCGNGQYLNKLSNAGFTKLLGFEGKIPEGKEFYNIIQQDLSKRFSLPQQGNCIFLEVAEHIPAQYEDIMLENIINACDDKLIMSWAIRGQGGYGHVNEINNDEAIIKVVSKGMTFLPQETMQVRSIISVHEHAWVWFKNTTLVFKKG